MKLEPIDKDRNPCRLDILLVVLVTVVVIELKILRREKERERIHTPILEDKEPPFLLDNLLRNEKIH